MPAPVSSTRSNAGGSGPAPLAWAATAVRIVTRPPPGMASRALRIRLIATCSRAAAPTATAPTRGLSSIRTSTSSPSSGASVRTTALTTRLRSATAEVRGCGRPAASSSRVRRSPRLVARRIASPRRRSGLSAGRPSSSSAVWAPIAAITLRRSCATLMVMRPRDSASSRRRRSPAVSSPPVVMSGVGRHVRHQRQDDPEERARARRAAYVDGAPVVLDDLLGERQPQAGSAFLGREKRIEDAVEVHRLDPRAGVLDLDGHTARAEARAPEGLGVAPGHAQREAAAAWHRVQRVGHEVDEGAIERLLIDPDGGHVLAPIAHDAHALRLETVAVQLEHALEKRRQPQRLEREARGAGQLQQPLDDGVDALELARDDRLELLAEVRILEASREMPAEGEQRRERVLDFVREPGRQLADRRQPVGAAQPVLELPHAREVSEHADHAELLALAAAQ